MCFAKRDLLKRKILIVDDHAVFREGLIRILGHEKDVMVCGDAEDGIEGIRKAKELKPDLIIVDISLEGMNGIQLIKNLRAELPTLRILVLSMHKEALHAERALRVGANGYIMKRERVQQLLAAIRLVLSGGTYVSEKFNAYLLGKLVSPTGQTGGSPTDTLTDRELEIFQLIGQGYGTRQMADALHLSIKTIEFHRENIRAKLNLNSTFELVQHAIHWSHYENENT